ncbi:hypothetical protein BASA81_006420 [Batrachochytrium salamandrivorans]|nr:hypothetical protein BASA81_006420 [Batrachochytrium salamandrivorans]
MVGCGAYVAASFSNGWESLISINAVYAGIAAGALLIIVSMIGCCAAKKDQNKCLVFVYAVLIIAALAIQIAAAVIVFDYSNALAGSENWVSGSLTDSTQVSINNGVLSSFTACCSGCPTGGVCNNAQAFFNHTLENCQSNTITCSQVPICATGTSSDCFVYPPSTPANKLLNPSTYIDAGVCTILSDLTQNGTKLVGSVDVGSCGGGNAGQYLNNVNEYFSSNFKWLAIAFAVLAGIEFLIIVCTLVIMCCSSRKRQGQ